MRLLERQIDGNFRPTKPLLDDHIPPYAILSHTWGADSEEVTFEDLVEGSGWDKPGYSKINFCGEQAARDGLTHFWVDSCSIKKSSDSELSEAINSMYSWYRRATKCYVYLSDVPTIEGYGQQQAAFRNSRWFTRGWTLQELLAPASVEFFTKEGRRLGDKESLKQEIYEITGIPLRALSGAPLSQFTVEARMQWAARRKTTRKEDRAYCLLGIFGVFISPIYGEGEHAFTRLEEAIDIKSSKEDHMERASKCRKVESYAQDVDQSLPPPTNKDLLDSLRFDQINDRFVNIKPSHKKTCKWLLQSTEYLDWLNADKLPEHHGFFWVKGKPGCGKSTLTKFAFVEAKKFFRNTTLLSFFFNARGDDLEKSTIGLYRSLLIQLLEKCPHYEEALNIPSLVHQPFGDQLKENREMLKHLFAQTVQIMDGDNIMVVIDALDECDEDEVREMVSFFEDLGEEAISNGRAFRVLFSSRHYPHITIERCVEMILEDQQGHSQDIDKYLFSELRAGKGKQAQQIRQEIVERASGIFMWVVLVVQILNKASDHGQAHALQKKLREIPSDLNELFRRMLTRDCQNMDEMKLCLQWILFAKRPMKREELYFAILSGSESDGSFLWDPDDISTDTMDLFLLSSSKGLAEVTKSKNPTVQFIHESVRDFLLKGNVLGLLWEDLKVNAVGLSHDRLKECCLNYMRSDITSYLNIEDPLIQASSPKETELRIRASLKFTFLEYAVNSIFAHADISHAQGVSQERFIEEFDLKLWVHLNNIMEKFQVRRPPQDVDISYTIAERNCPNLIDISRRIRPNGQQGRYGNPIFAAIANNSGQALEVFIKRDNQTCSPGCVFPYSSDGMYSFLIKHGKSALTHRFLSVYNVDVNLTLRRYRTLLV